MKKKCLCCFTSLVCFFLAGTFLSGCRFFNTMGESLGGKDYNAQIKKVSLSKTSLSINEGESEYIKLTLNPSEHQNKCDVSWEYNKECISLKADNFGAVVQGLKGGGTYIKAKCNGIVATCLVAVVPTGDDSSKDPYIYSNFAVIELKPKDNTAVSVSLYGGNVAEMELFEWSIKDDSIADIACSRNNCVITAKKEGSTQLRAHHPKAKYDYTFVVYVYTDAMTSPYITTDSNILTIDKNNISSKTLTVDLKNPLSQMYKNGFRWDYADEQSKKVIELNSNLDSAEIIPKGQGIAKINVTHENAKYPLSIIIRVTAIVKNTYIGLSQSSLLVLGSENTYSVYASIENYEGYADPDKFVWEIPESSKNLMSYYANGNCLSITGKKNGIIKVKVSHELSEYSRNLLIILEQQIGSAVDSSMYITTEQNYVQTKVGNPEHVIPVRLVGGDVGDEKDFIWSIDKGKDNGIAKVVFVNGDVQARNAAESGKSAEGKLIIEPIASGTLNITVKHPRCLYDCDITVRVYSKYAILGEAVTIETEKSLIKLLNGNSELVKATVKNGNKGDENNILWTSSDNSVISVSPDEGEQTLASAAGSGSHQTYIKAHLDKAISDKQILVLSADTQEELDSMKAIYSDTSYVRLIAGKSKEVELKHFGLKATDRISWISSDFSVCTVNADSTGEYAQKAVIEGIKEGEAKIIASIQGSQSVTLNITVVPKDESDEPIQSPKYLTTNLNAIILKEVGESKNISVSGVGIESENLELYTDWSMKDENAEIGKPVFTLSGSPSSKVNITSERKGKSVITVSNKFSSNSLKINAKCGELYEWKDGYSIYITSDKDVVNVLNGGSTTVGCALVNTTSTGSFSWKVIEGKDKIEITGLAQGTCQIEGKQAGQAIISVSNTLSGEITKEILVNVANSVEELNGFKYLTTEQNVVSVGEKNNTSVSVSVKNAQGNIINGYSWRSTDSNIASVSSSGNVGVIYGKNAGSTKIIVENNECAYTLEIIVNVVDPVAASKDPYIACANIVTCTIGSPASLLQAELVGGLPQDNTEFSWSIVDSGIASLHAANNSAQVKALKEGVTQIVVQHPKAGIERRILVICEKQLTTECYISVAESIIKMSPSDEARTINAVLVNGQEKDVYGFKWWADSYDKIDMNYSTSSCVIKPLSSGTVTLHVSHPKAANQKDIILYISNYTDFAFESSNITLTTGSSSFVNMEVPATGVKCEISYSSSDNSLCTAAGNLSVCNLNPGILPNGVNSKSCKIKAILQTKGGVKQAEAELLVIVQRKDESKPFIAFDGSTILTMNKNEKKNLKAFLYGKNTVDKDGAGLKWSIANNNGIVADFTSDKRSGSDVQIKAISSGRTTITIKHDEAPSPLTLCVIVNGESETSVSLNYTELPVYIGEDTQNLIATVVNDKGEELEWTVVDEKNPGSKVDFFTFNAKGNKASIFAKKVGEATVYCKIPSTGIFASCKVIIKESEKINFFIYDDETLPIEKRIKSYISNLQLYPGQAKILHYETIPAKAKVKKWYIKDATFYSVNDKGFVDTFTDSQGNTYSYPENVGTVILTGKATEGSSIVTATTISDKSDSLSVTNSYNYFFSISKSMISANPKQVHDKPDLLTVNYEVRPACSKILVTVYGKKDNTGKAVSLQSGTYSSYDDSQGKYTITKHVITSETAATGIVKGKIQFRVDGECNCNVNIEAINENVVTSGITSATTATVGSENLNLKVFWKKHTFVPSITKRVPYINHTSSVFGKNQMCNAYSSFDNVSNTFFIGDGEYIEGSIRVKEEYSSANISNIEFIAQETSIKDSLDDNKGKVQSSFLGATYTPSTDGKTAYFALFHKKDYGCVTYTDEDGNVKQHKRFYRLSNTGDEAAENRNTTVKEKPYVGKLRITYYDYAASSPLEYFIPVYVEVRNCPCINHSIYKPLHPAGIEDTQE